MTDPQSSFVAGHRLSLALYRQVVEPALARTLPRLQYAAGLIGFGSDVLGYDTATSTDHDWGPRTQIVVNDADRHTMTPLILDAIESQLPDTVDGVSLDVTGGANLPGDEIHHHNSPSGRQRHHGITVTSVEQLQHQLLGVNEHPHCWTPAHWLVVPRQSLLEFTAGPIHRDDAGILSGVRSALAWYPHEIWLYVMSGRWQRIAQHEAFVGRAAQVGDDIGSRVIAAQIVQDVMHLALLQHRIYAPYPKWLGTRFTSAESDDSLTAPIAATLAAATAANRQDALVATLLELSRRHDRLEVTEPMNSKAEPFWSRPFPVIWSERIAQALHQAIASSDRAGLPYGLGGIDEITNSTDALKNAAIRRQLQSRYQFDH